MFSFESVNPRDFIHLGDNGVLVILLMGIPFLA